MPGPIIIGGGSSGGASYDDGPITGRVTALEATVAELEDAPALTHAVDVSIAALTSLHFDDLSWAGLGLATGNQLQIDVYVLTESGQYVDRTVLGTATYAVPDGDTDDGLTAIAEGLQPGLGDSATCVVADGVLTISAPRDASGLPTVVAIGNNTDYPFVALFTFRVPSSDYDTVTNFVGDDVPAISAADATFSGNYVVDDAAAAITTATQVLHLDAPPTNGETFYANGKAISFSTGQTTVTGSSDAGYVVGIGEGATSTVGDVVAAMAACLGDGGNGTVTSGRIGLTSPNYIDLYGTDGSLASFGLSVQHANAIFATARQIRTTRQHLVDIDDSIDDINSSLGPLASTVNGNPAFGAQTSSYISIPGTDAATAHLTSGSTIELTAGDNSSYKVVFQYYNSDNAEPDPTAGNIHGIDIGGGATIADILATIQSVWRAYGGSFASGATAGIVNYGSDYVQFAVPTANMTVGGTPYGDWAISTGTYDFTPSTALAVEIAALTTRVTSAETVTKSAGVALIASTRTDLPGPISLIGFYPDPTDGYAKVLATTAGGDGVFTAGDVAFTINALGADDETSLAEYSWTPADGDTIVEMMAAFAAQGNLVFPAYEQDTNTFSFTGDTNTVYRLAIEAGASSQLSAVLGLSEGVASGYLTTVFLSDMNIASSSQGNQVLLNDVIRSYGQRLTALETRIAALEAA